MYTGWRGQIWCLLGFSDNPTFLFSSGLAACGYLHSPASEPRKWVFCFLRGKTDSEAQFFSQNCLGPHLPPTFPEACTLISQQISVVSLSGSKSAMSVAKVQLHTRHIKMLKAKHESSVPCSEHMPSTAGCHCSQKKKRGPKTDSQLTFL